MARGFVSVLVGGAVVAAALAGCSTDNNTPAPRGGTISSHGIAIAQSNTAKVTIDGTQHKVDGPVACTDYDDEFVIVIGHEPHGVKATLSTGNPPSVSSVHLGDIAGTTLLYTDIADKPRPPRTARTTPLPGPPGGWTRPTTR
ncbi:hypothetical protein E2F47_23475 [Mycobacterium eburneum]|nr:hypothetical protein E2F47_23475 [Mycobacterium eburneum]